MFGTLHCNFTGISSKSHWNFTRIWLSMPQAPHEAHRRRVWAVYMHPPRSLWLCELNLCSVISGVSPRSDRNHSQSFSISTSAARPRALAQPENHEAKTQKTSCTQDFLEDSSSTALGLRWLTDVVVITRVSGQGKATARLISRAKLPSIVPPPLQRAPPASAQFQSIPATPLAQDIVRIVDDIPHCYASED